MVSDSWLASLGCPPLQPKSHPQVVPTTTVMLYPPARSTSKGPPLQRAPHRNRGAGCPSDAAPARTSAAFHPSLLDRLPPPVPVVLLAIQAIITTPVDPNDAGAWSAATAKGVIPHGLIIASMDETGMRMGVWTPTGTALKVPDGFGVVETWTGAACPPWVAEALAAGAQAVTCQFAAAQQVYQATGWPAPATWKDTAVLLANRNRDADLDEIAAWLLDTTPRKALPPKVAGKTTMPAGLKVAIDQWSLLRGFPGIVAGRNTDLDAAVKQALVAARVALSIAGKVGLNLSISDEEALPADQAANRHGIPVDRKLGEAAVTIGKAIGRPMAVNKITEVLAHCCEDGYVRGAYHFLDQFHGRWSAKNPALHNERKVTMKEPKVNQLIRVVKRMTKRSDFKLLTSMAPDKVEALLGNLERPLFCAPPGQIFVVGDQKQAEPRGVFYFSGLNAVLQQMDAADLYLDPALQIRLFGDEVPVDHPDAKRRRTVIKVLIIACGYGMGHKCLIKYALDGWNLDLAKVGVDAVQAVNAYRQRFSKVPKLWYRLQDASIEAMASGRDVPTPVGRFIHAGKDLILVLYSDRAIVYPEAALAEDDYGKPVLSYRKGGPLTGFRGTAWGGNLLQHAVSGTLRDVHAAHIASMVAQGLVVVSHTHDEAAALVPESNAMASLDLMKRVMNTTPWYLTGLPLRCEPATTYRLGCAGLVR